MATDTPTMPPRQVVSGAVRAILVHIDDARSAVARLRVACVTVEASGAAEMRAGARTSL